MHQLVNIFDQTIPEQDVWISSRYSSLHQISYLRLVTNARGVEKVLKSYLECVYDCPLQNMLLCGMKIATAIELQVKINK